MNQYFFQKTSTFLVFSLLLSIQDIKAQKVGRFFLFPPIVFIFLINLFYEPSISLIYAASSIIFAVLYFIIRKITKGKLGTADIFYGIIQGLCVLPSYIWICLSVETVGAALFILLKKSAQKEKPLSALKIPFIPFMFLGALVAYFLPLIFLHK